MLLSAEKISKNFGGRPLLTDVELYMNAGDKIGLIGRNGAGKSTLLKILAGREAPDSGRVSADPGVRISMLSQTPEMHDEMDILDQVFAGLGEAFREENEFQAKTMLTKLSIDDFSRKIGALSGGQRKRVALAEALVRPAELLILDEPTNHLDGDMVAWLEEQLIRRKGALLMVTHDRYFLENVVGRIVELDGGKLYGYEANYSKYLELKSQREEMTRASERKRQALLKKEYEWIMRGARARTTKSTERIARYEALKAQEAPQEAKKVEMAAAASRLGRKTVEIRDVSKAFDGREIIRNFSYTVLRDDRIGIVGKNGAGKSTLLNLMAGRLAPDRGEVDMGGTVQIGYFTQEGKELDLNQRAYDYIAEIAGSVRTGEGTFSASQMMERFLFPPEMQYAPIGKLSGGERRRLYLLGVLMSAPNILLLDEPTNDLDIETLTVLEDYLTEFPGAVLTVSHDRYFLDKIANAIFEVRDGAVYRYVGNYADYLQKRIQEKQAEKPKPRENSPEAPRPKNKKLKFSFKEQREYDAIDQDIADLEEKIQEKEAEIAQNASDYVTLQRLIEEKAALEKAHEEKMERWVYLNELAEQIAAQK